ncbi:MAG: cellulase family glycosylhydrolase [Anaerolineales bacterium]|nr:cellulase family glycosylhydrolase [Anaerolineales bacterium]
MDITKFHDSGAAIVHQTHGDPFPKVIWPSNSSKLAAATMFTLFFGGDDFAPASEVEGEQVGSYLQRHYIESIRRVADRLKDLPNVVGYGTMNEPLRGYIGWENLRAPGGIIRLGPSPTPLQAMLLGSGIPQQVDVWGLGVRGEQVKGSEWVNPLGVRAWLPGYDCVWRRAGVWDYDAKGQPQLLRPDHFTRVEGRKVDFSHDYYLPFANRFSEVIRSVHPQALIFIESDPRNPPPKWGLEDASGIVYAPHWYDGYVLFMKNFWSFLAVDFHTGDLILGPRRVRRSFSEQLGRFLRESRERLGNAPVMLGEFGIAFDLRNKRAYRSGDFNLQVKAMDRSFRAVEDNLLSCTLWNYTSDNSNARGDQWNGEDLSIFSRDQQLNPADIHSGGRALDAVVRPYPRKVAGEPQRMVFDYKGGVFEFLFKHDTQIEAPTEIFVPNLQFPGGYTVEVSDGTFEVDLEEQILSYRHESAQDVHVIRLRRKVEAK